MITGAHFLLYSSDPAADQAALERILGTRSVPAQPGRIILALPPAEIATHTGSGDFTQRHADRDLLGLVLYLMCDDLPSVVRELEQLGIPCTGIEEAEFGLKTTVRLPGGGEIGLYQPSHETALESRAVPGR
ncbi:MAG: VOC family protein [Gemmatimonadota bacterium]